MKKTPKKPVKRPRSCVMETSFLEDLRFWVGGDRKIAIRVLDLVEAVMRDPFDGIGKPEPLKYSSANTWSRRIIDEHRLLYIVQNEEIAFIQARFHYSKQNILIENTNEQAFYTSHP